MQQKLTLVNKRGEKLVGVLHETGSAKLVVLCHGFRSTKEYNIMVNIAAALENEGISAFRFDFSGNGESEGGDVVLLYASKYHDIPAVVSVSGRYDLKTGLEERLGKTFLEKIKKDGYIDVKTRSGEVDYQVTEESVMERLNTNMHEACLSIDERCRVLIVHGSADEVIPVEDALEFAKIIRNNRLQIIDGANHGYSSHQDELTSAVLPFIKECVQQCEDIVPN